MAHRKEFYLYQRHKKGGDYWYVCYLDRKTGKQLSAKSIDVLKERIGILDFKSVDSREEAEKIAVKALERDVIFKEKRKIYFVDYVLSFWDFDTSEYITLRNNLNKGSIGKEYAYNMKKGFIKNVLPLLPSSLLLEEVTVEVLDSVIKGLYQKGLSNGTISSLKYSFSLPLKEATRLGLISFNPADKLLPITIKNKERGVLSEDETKKLIEALKENKEKLNPSIYYAILLGILTGMRCSEIRALSREDIVITGDHAKVLIRHSVGYISGKKGTKGKYERAVLIPKSLGCEIINNSSGAVLFPSLYSSKEYISSPSIRKELYYLLKAIGISEEERKERDITFHSLRHTYSTLMSDKGVRQEDRMLVLGHKSKTVNDRYTHRTDEALERIYSFSESLFIAT